MEKELLNFIADYEHKAAELEKKFSIASFNASISGKEEDFELSSKYELELNKFYANKEMFESIKKFKQSNQINEPILQRYVELLYNRFASNQFDEQMLEKIQKISSKIEKKYSTFRATFNGKSITDNEIERILIESKNLDQLKSVWEASKQIGNEVADDVIELVKLRNESAKSLGFANYFEKSYSLNEQSVSEIEKLFDDLDELTKDEFFNIKNEMDRFLAHNLGINVEDLQPYHYKEKFFQHAPVINSFDLDKYFEDKNLVEITRSFYNGLGLNIDDLLEKSDLFEKEGKYQHAYCTSIDRAGDVRVLCNIKNNCRWMGTMLHEFGHAVYDKYISDLLPWELRTHVHIFATEAIAMFFGRLVFNADWLRYTLDLNEEEYKRVSDFSYKALKFDQLVFSRWVQVVFRFEKAMYENPNQNLNELWWRLVEKYQGLRKPFGRNNPDWAAKIHIALYPAYYHNYMLGELLASQLWFFIKDKVLKINDGDDSSLYNKKELGEYFINLFFSYGALYKWDELIKKATGEVLSPKYYAKQFIG